MYTIVDNLDPVDTIFLLEIRVEPGFDVLYNGLPATIDTICESDTSSTKEEF